MVVSWLMRLWRFIIYHHQLQPLTLKQFLLVHMLTLRSVLQILLVKPLLRPVFMLTVPLLLQIRQTLKQ